ncbi:MAG: hypothetical protein K2O24_00830 [Muribaculaceae bacterium]|nr:hypothetical protein [Muribaculaceae bacterium]
MAYDISEFHNDAYIRTILSFAQKSVPGERSLAERLAPAVSAQFDEFIRRYVSTEPVFESLPPYIREMVYKVALLRGLAKSSGMLDVVLTPTGLGVISSSSMAPASAQRSERLRTDAMALADYVMAALLQHLWKADFWDGSATGRFWRSSPVWNPDGVRASGYDELMQLLPAIHSVYAHLSENLLGGNLADALVDAAATPGVGPLARLAAGVALLLGRAAGDDISPRRLCFEVAGMICECHPALELWKDSRQYSSWNLSAGFANDRRRPGYFF